MVEFAVLAKVDVRSAHLWFTGIRTGLAEAFMQELDVIVGRIAENPDLYQQFDMQTRRAVFRKFDYAIVYRPLPDRIQVIALLHCRLDPAKALERLGAIDANPE